MQLIQKLLGNTYETSLPSDIVGVKQVTRHQGATMRMLLIAIAAILSLLFIGVIPLLTVADQINHRVELINSVSGNPQPALQR